MNITGSTRVFFILGDPIAQVRAPEIYNHLFSRHGIDAVLVPVQVPATALEAFVRSALRWPDCLTKASPQRHQSGTEALAKRLRRLIMGACKRA